jgi:hypothetical protein
MFPFLFNSGDVMTSHKAIQERFLLWRKCCCLDLDDMLFCGSEVPSMDADEEQLEGSLENRDLRPPDAAPVPDVDIPLWVLTAADVEAARVLPAKAVGLPDGWLDTGDVIDGGDVDGCSVVNLDRDPSPGFGEGISQFFRNELDS